eukprot:6240659-Prymnesium_polylepis.1
MAGLLAGPGSTGGARVRVRNVCAPRRGSNPTASSPTRTSRADAGTFQECGGQILGRFEFGVKRVA